ncbi:PREDICTED: GPI transamidase component PIG-T-like [Priapulus caudatus]|uniref:GPI transamidase component PIG-T-like n=1 Tax=Priapulus caudatus TaxID=37621 RepID=A0ABM1E575_PRICU|nr:PREDICTED: GPI transamidase component PIG-T-like [Priapulus caudatus]
MAARRVVKLLYVVITCCFFAISVCDKDNYVEELFIKPLNNGFIYTHFQFTTKWNVSIWQEESLKHYNVFPKSLGDTLQAFSIQELHLTLTQGLWRHSKWGYPVRDAPPGAELWVWFQDTVEDIDQQWISLTNALSGQFCASLNFLDGTSTVQPQLSFRPEGINHKDKSVNSSYIRYAALPKENVCTENLTPWKKLLPCGEKTGLGSLLKAKKLYDANYHSLAVSIRPVCRSRSSCEDPSLELSQSLSLVIDNHIRNNGRRDWSLRQLFGETLSGHCPLASRSVVYTDTTDIEGSAILSPPPGETHIEMNHGHTRTYAVHNVKDFTLNNGRLNIGAKYTTSLIPYTSVQPPILHAQRFASGYGQERGGIVCLLHNEDPHANITVIYMESIPWYIRVYFHTLTIESEGVKIKPEYQHFVAGKDRARPHLMELVFTLPRSSTTRLSIEFDRAFLKWTEYPPDASQGFLINSAVISTVLVRPPNHMFGFAESSELSHMFNNTRETYFMRLHTETLLVALATPDFSMPYNVICLVCTVVAIAFGSIHNLTTRRFIVEEAHKKGGIIGKIKNFFRRKSVPAAQSEGSEIKSHLKDS